MSVQNTSEISQFGFSALSAKDSVTRVLHVIASVNPRGGGPIEGILQQVAHTPTDQFEIHIASLDDPDDDVVLNCPARVFALGERAGGRSFWRNTSPWWKYGYRPRMLPWLMANCSSYDVVVINGLWNYSVLAAWSALRSSDVPYAVFTHGMLDPWFRKTYPLKSLLKQVFWLFSEGPLLNHAAAVLFTTPTERRVSRNAFWPYRVRGCVVGYGTADIPGNFIEQVAAFRTAFPKIVNRPFLLYLSRIHPKKGCDILIDGFAAVAAEYPDLDLVIAGPDATGWRPKLESRAKKLGISKRIHWPGMLIGDLKWGAYHCCEAFVLPSHQENFGVVVAEAMAAGKPVLISNKVQIHEEIQAANCGLIEADTANGVGLLLGRFLSLEDKAREDMGIAARNAFLDNFEISRVIAKLNTVLQEISSRHSISDRIVDN